MPTDSAPEKWIYWEHTRVKHEILKGYLGGWLSILGRYHQNLCYFDCFAGRGEYQDGSPGSPLIALQIANELIQNNKVGQVACVFIEKDADNFSNLETVLKQHKELHPNIKVVPVQDEFATVTSQVLEELGDRLAPSFFFVDPFGFTGVPFKLIKEIFTIPRTEIFFTFMYDSINRFLSSANVEIVFDNLFETKKWRPIIDKIAGQQREHALRDLYIEQLRYEAGARYTRAFRVCTDEKLKTLYYLIHATKHPKGALLMKEVMHRKGAPGMFAYLGPADFTFRHQPRLFDENDIPSLKTYLLEHFGGQTLNYYKVREESWETPFLDTHYRKAVKELASEEGVILEGAGPRGGIKGDTKITFRGHP